MESIKKDTTKILNSYLESVLFTEELDERSIAEFSLSSKDVSLEQINRFVAACGDLLDEWDESQIGHDFWLTRCGHGTGFWDRDLPNGDAISEICENFRFHGLVFSEDAGNKEVVIDMDTL